MKNYKDNIIWIIGASSGIGAALAKELSARGAILLLSARRKDELETLNTELGGQHKVFAFDVSDEKATMSAAQGIYGEFGQIDRIIYMAAAYAPMKIDTLDIAQTKKIIDVNIMGAFNLIHAAMPILKSQKKKGQLALCGSVAGYIGLPGGQPYSATKAAIINIAESLHAELSDLIDVRLISPGFVRTPLTDKNDFKMPMMVEPEQAAKEIADGLLSRSFEIHFPKKFTFFLKILGFLPYPLALNLTRHIKT